MAILDAIRAPRGAAGLRTAVVALCGAAAVLALVATLVLAVAGIVRVLTGSDGAGGDFLSFYAAGEIVRAHGGTGLYDAAVQAGTQRALYPGELERATGYPLPVVAAWGFAPLSMLPFAAAFAVWTAMNIVLLAALAIALARYLAPVPALPRRAFVAAFALSIPAVTNIVFGQVDLIIFAAMFGAYGLLRRERDVAAGSLLALVVIKPHFLIGVVPMLILQRRWRALTALGCAGGALVLVPALITSPDALAANVRFVAGYPGAGDDLQVMAGMMANWRGFIVSVTGNDAIWLWLPGLAAIASGAFVLAVPVWMRKPRAGADAHSYALAVLLPLLASPHLHTQSLVLLFIPLALALRSQAVPAAFSDDQRQTAIVAMTCALYAALFVLWVLTATGLSLTVFLVAAIYAALALKWADAEAAAVDDTAFEAKTQPTLKERVA